MFGRAPSQHFRLHTHGYAGVEGKAMKWRSDMGQCASGTAAALEGVGDTIKANAIEVMINAL
jgi:hypothetical protein